MYFNTATLSYLFSVIYTLVITNLDFIHAIVFSCYIVIGVICLGSFLYICYRITAGTTQQQPQAKKSDESTRNVVAKPKTNDSGKKKSDQEPNKKTKKRARKETNEVPSNKSNQQVKQLCEATESTGGKKAKEAPECSPVQQQQPPSCKKQSVDYHSNTLPQQPREFFTEMLDPESREYLPEQWKRVLAKKLHAKKKKHQKRAASCQQVTEAQIKKVEKNSKETSTLELEHLNEHISSKREHQRKKDFTSLASELDERNCLLDKKKVEGVGKEKLNILPYLQDPEFMKKVESFRCITSE